MENHLDQPVDPEVVDQQPVELIVVDNEVTQQAVATVVDIAPVSPAEAPTTRRRTSETKTDGSYYGFDLFEKKTKETSIPGDDDNIRIYLEDIGKVDLLTKEDEIELAKAYERGVIAAAELEERGEGMPPAERRAMKQQVKEGKQAEKQFVEANLRLVVSIAKKYQASGTPLLDLIQDGNLGLMHAVEKFDWRKGFKFSTYATWWIRQAIGRAIANTNAEIRLPVHAYDNNKRLMKARATIELRKASQGLPASHATTAELAEELDMAEAAVKRLIQDTQTQYLDSFDRELTGHHDSATLGDVVGDPNWEKQYEAVSYDMDVSEGLTQALDILDPRERTILKLRYGLDGGIPLTLELVGQELNLTRERIRQLEVRGLSKLRHPSNYDNIGAMRLYL